MKVNLGLSVASLILATTGFATTVSGQTTGAYQSAGYVTNRVVLSDCDNGCDSGCDTGCDTCCDSGCDGGCDSGCDSGCGSGCGIGSIVGSLCNLGDEIDIFGTSCCGIEVGGWVEAGYYNRNNGLFHKHPDRFNADQVWLYVGREADGSEGLDWGFRSDMMYGTDAADTQAFGNDWNAAGNPTSWDNSLNYGGGYGWAFPQLYAEVAMGNLSVKAGHYFTLAGYETVAAPGNFFYSHSYTMNNSEPFTHTGVLSTYTVGDNLTLYSAWNLGWDTGFDQFGGGTYTSQYDKGNEWMSGFSLTLMEDLTVTYINTWGDHGYRGYGYTHSIVCDLSITEKLNWVVQSDLVANEVNNPLDVKNGAPGATNDQVGINQYLLYQLSDCVGIGTRIEWWKSSGQSAYECTAGINWFPHANLRFRPEVRYDWGNANLITADARERVQFGIDAILTY